jgi:hypothetical protein
MRQQVQLIARGMLALTAAAVLLTGCGRAAPAPAPARTQSAAAAGPTVRDSANGYGVQLPAGYRAITDPAQAATLAAPLPSADRALVTQQIQRAFRQGAKLMAIKSTGRAVDSINVVVIPAQGLTPAAFADRQGQDRLTAPLTQLGAKNVVATPMRIAGTPGLRISYSLPAGNRLVQGVQLYAVNANRAYITTLMNQTAGAVPADEVALVAATLRLG